MERQSRTTHGETPPDAAGSTGREEGEGEGVKDETGKGNKTRRRSRTRRARRMRRRLSQLLSQPHHQCWEEEQHWHKLWPCLGSAKLDACHPDGVAKAGPLIQWTCRGEALENTVKAVGAGGTSGNNKEFIRRFTTPVPHTVAAASQEER